MKFFLVAGGLLLIVICFIPFRHKLSEYETQKSGDLIVATITNIPQCYGTRSMHFIKFVYAGRVFDKKVSCGFKDKYKVGDTIKLKHTEGTNNFLFENENIVEELIELGLIGLMGIGCTYKGIRIIKTFN